MNKVYSASNPTEAHLLRGLLEAEGIESEVRGDVLFGARGEIPLTQETAPTVWIRDRARLADARRVIARYEKRQKEPGSSGDQWRCGGCGELHEAQFTHCWKCGRGGHTVGVT